MIKSFKCKDTEKLFNDLDVKKFRNISRETRMKLEVLNATVSLEGLKVPPGNSLEALKGDRKGQYSIRIDSQYRICFSWLDGNTYEVEIGIGKGSNRLLTLVAIFNNQIMHRINW